MFLRERLAAYRRRRDGAEIRAAYEEFLQRLDAGSVAAEARKPGEAMPCFVLPNAEGTLVDSAELLGRGPLIVTFFRGSWCPYCAMTLDALEAVLPQVRQAGATLVALTPETGGLALAMKRQHGFGYEILIDVDLAVAMQFGIVFCAPPLYASLLARNGIDLAARQGNPGWFLPVPATFLVDPDGMIRESWVDIDFTHRAEPEEVLAALAGIGRTTRSQPS